MPCTHLRELYELCKKHDLRITSHDAVRIVCRQCEQQDVCPSSLTDGEHVLQMPKEETPLAAAPEASDPSGESLTTESPAPVERRPR